MVLLPTLPPQTGTEDFVWYLTRTPVYVVGDFERRKTRTQNESGPGPKIDQQVEKGP